LGVEIEQHRSEFEIISRPKENRGGNLNYKIKELKE